ncbi:MAG: helix-turn-helix transcriptional regulator [Cyanophyceae cyanobacterium]
MTITLRDDEFVQLLQDETQSLQPELLKNPRDRTLVLPSCLGTGYKRDIVLERDISLTLHHYQLHEDTIISHSKAQRDCFEFSFIDTGKALVDEYLFQAHQDALFQNSDMPAAEVLQYADQRFLAVDVHIEKSVLATMFEAYGETVPPELRSMVAGNDDRPVLPPLKIQPVMQQLLQKIWHCPYEGLTRSLFLEAKSLELIGLYLQETHGDRNPNDSVSKLQAADIDSIRNAQNILQQNLNAPPSLMELARQVGINDRKLKQGFRELFDTTVFGYLTQQRMERACQLLTQEISVSTVAFLVGYKSPTAFSGAFRRTLGITPKAYQMSKSRRA